MCPEYCLDRMIGAGLMKGIAQRLASLQTGVSWEALQKADIPVVGAKQQHIIEMMKPWRMPKLRCLNFIPGNGENKLCYLRLCFLLIGQQSHTRTRNSLHIELLPSRLLGFTKSRMGDVSVTPLMWHSHGDTVPKL